MSTTLSEELEKIGWYHPNLDRHVAESLLINNASDGTYLMRPSSANNPGSGSYAVSVRCNNSVKHFMVEVVNDEIYFGYAIFKTIGEFLSHFDSQPLISGESNQLILLKNAYPREVQEPQLYEAVKVHAVYNPANTGGKSKTDYAVNSKEGFLTKCGHVFKTWKTRWFVLQNNRLSYYREKSSKVPIKTLDLSQALECSEITLPKRNYVFQVVFKWRTFLIYASTEAEMLEWMKMIKWRIDKYSEPPTLA